MTTIHIKGWGKNINVTDKLSDNYNVPFDFGTYDNAFEETAGQIPNARLRIYSTDEKTTLKEAEEGHLKEVLGTFSVRGSQYGYSEYTIMGFDITRARIGGHDIQKYVDEMSDKYLHILISFEEEQ